MLNSSSWRELIFIHVETIGTGFFVDAWKHHLDVLNGLVNCPLSVVETYGLLS